MALRVDSTITGIHSRSEEAVKVSRDFDRGRASERQLVEVFDRDARNLVDLEASSGLSLVSDGQMKWQDFLRPFSESFEGLESGADLSRWFDTNSFYRKPSVTGEIGVGRKRKFSLKKYDVLSAFEEKKIGKHSDRKFKRKISVPGPYTAASLVDDKHYKSKRELVNSFAKALQSVVDELAESGFESVQINEPALVYRYGISALTDKNELDYFLSAYEEHFSKTKSNIILHTYFGDCSKILPDLLELEGPSAIGIDFTQTSLSDIEKARFDGKSLACGCIDGRNSLVESPEWIAKYCYEAYRTLKPSGLIVLPSSELKYLPREYADLKVKSIGRAAEILRKQLK